VLKGVQLHRAVQPLSPEVPVGIEGITPPGPALSPVPDHLTNNVKPAAPQKSRGRRILNVDATPTVKVTPAFKITPAVKATPAVSLT
jgi:hypothetical protein